MHDNDLNNIEKKLQRIDAALSNSNSPEYYEELNQIMLELRSVGVTNFNTSQKMTLRAIDSIIKVLTKKLLDIQVSIEQAQMQSEKETGLVKAYYQ